MLYPTVGIYCDFYGSNLLKIDLCQEKNAAKKAKMQKAAKALDYELYLCYLCEAGQNDEMLKQIELGFDIDEKQVQIKRAYFQKFKERLNAKQLKQVFQRAEGFNKARHPQQGQRPGMGGRGGDGFGGPGFGDGDF